MNPSIPSRPDRPDTAAEVRRHFDRDRLLELAETFGLDRRGRRIACPHGCSNDPRGATVFEGDSGGAWNCKRCGKGGSAIDLLMARGLDFKDALAELAARAGIDTSAPRPVLPSPAPKPAPRVPQRPPRPEVEALWAACVRVDRTLIHPDASDLAASGFLAQRRFFPLHVAGLDVARLLPLPEAFPYPAWWPARWVRTWRLAVPAYEPNGTLASLHARAVAPVSGDDPKTRWPKDCDAGGLLMADAAGLALLRGESTAEAAIVAEGLTDLIAFSLWSTRTGRGWPVLAVTSGGARAFADVRWPAGAVCYVATDNDAQGDKYAAEVRAALPAAVKVRRVRFG